MQQGKYYDGQLVCDTVIGIPGERPVNPSLANGSILLLPGYYQDVKLTVSTILSSSANSGGIVFGYVDPLNYWIVMAHRAAGKYYLYQVSNGDWVAWGSSSAGAVSSSGGTFDLRCEVRSGSVCDMASISNYNAVIPAGQVGVWAGSGSGSVKFDNFVVRSLAANCVVDGRFTDDSGNVRVSGGYLEFFNSDGTTRRSVLRHVRLSTGVVQADLVYRSGITLGLLLHYQDPENFMAVTLEGGPSNILAGVYEVVDGKAPAQVDVNDTTGFNLTNGTTYTLRAVIDNSGPSGTQCVKLYVGPAGGSLTLRLSSTTIDDRWSGGRVGLYRASSTTTTTIQWDKFKCGVDNNADGDIDDGGDYIYANYDFNDPSGSVWQKLTFTHDAAGNLTADGPHLYRYDAWNRLAGVWYADAGGTGDAGQRVAAFAYDALFRRVSKTVSNQGLGCVHGSDAGGMAGIQAGDRVEHYFYSGWRLIEERDGSDRTLAQTVFGTQYIDEPICRDRNTDPVAGGSADNDCLDAGGSQRYFYHQDANYRVTLLTAEAGGVVERYDYSAYGEPALLGGAVSGGLGESGAALTVSSVGNPLMHQGLYRDGESGSYQNRYRQYGSGVGRWMQVDPLGYWESLNPREYLRSIALRGTDGLGLGDDYEKEIIIQQAHRDRALILIAGAGDAAGEVAHGIDRAAVASVVIMLPGPDDAIIAVALGTKIGARVAGLIADTLKDAKVVRTGSRGRSTIVEIKDIAQRDKDWDRLTKGAKVDDKGGGVKVATHPDGTKIIKRPSTKDGRDTIEIQAPDGTTTKVRYGDKPDCPDAKKDGNAPGEQNPSQPGDGANKK